MGFWCDRYPWRKIVETTFKFDSGTILGPNQQTYQRRLLIRFEPDWKYIENLVREDLRKEGRSQNIDADELKKRSKAKLAELDPATPNKEIEEHNSFEPYVTTGQNLAATLWKKNLPAFKGVSGTDGSGFSMVELTAPPPDEKYKGAKLKTGPKGETTVVQDDVSVANPRDANYDFILRLLLWKRTFPHRELVKSPHWYAWVSSFGENYAKSSHAMGSLLYFKLRDGWNADGTKKQTVA